MAAVVEIVSILERTAITKEALETTRLGRYINELRRKTSNDSLARRAKDLVRRWRDMILPASTEPPPPPPVAQNGASATSRQPPTPVASHLSPASSNTSPVLLQQVTTETAVPRTHASNKRLRKEDTAPPTPAKKPKLNGASLPVPTVPPPQPSPHDQCTEIVTIDDDDVQPPPQSTDPDSKLSSSKTKKSRQKDKKSSNLTSSSSSSSERRRSKSDKKRLGGDDILKEKIASIARTPRVKTTQELVADLRSRRNSETALVDSDNVKVAAASVCDELVLSRNKTEHLEKFLRSSQKHESDEDCVVVVDLVDESEGTKKKGADVKERSTKDHKRSKQSSTAVLESESTNPERTLQDILSRLPPLDVDSIVWDESPPVSPPPPRQITIEDVDRLHNENVENLNGNYDHAPVDIEPNSMPTPASNANFRQWHETVSRTSYNDELLHILPYVVID
ncbi:mediator of RNA polymerase II transcription subunit 26 isoform X2 [Nilaparvata lugens]|nr:mediator of RNA polymerase II transcription subunit 26 isoform X2 [Nilaparvata lugens]